MLNNIHCIDCLEGVPLLDSQSVDLIFADLPYGKTQNKWDSIIPMDKLWENFERVAKPKTVFVFTAIQPFTSLIVSSNLKWFKYEMIWKKNKPRGFLNAKKQPLRNHENVLVFYKEQPDYIPQMTTGHPPVHAYTKKTTDGTNYGKTKLNISGGGSTKRYPTSILDINVVNNDGNDKFHPTQKPIELSAWFIKTYTKENDIVLDPTAGSGSTLVSAKILKRRFVGFETDPEMVKICNNRLDILDNL